LSEEPRQSGIVEILIRVNSRKYGCACWSWCRNSLGNTRAGKDASGEEGDQLHGWGLTLLKNRDETCFRNGYQALDILDLVVAKTEELILYIWVLVPFLLLPYDWSTWDLAIPLS
jgi:hypothetical protein